MHAGATAVSSRRWGAVAVCLLAAGVVGCSSDDDAGDADPSNAAGSGDPATTQSVPSDADTEADVEADPGSTDITIVSVSEGFQPAGLTVEVGTEVVWTNVDAITHTSTADDGTWDSGDLGVSEAFSFVADTPGTYAYFCAIHPSMVGELIVQ